MLQVYDCVGGYYNNSLISFSYTARDFDVLSTGEVLLLTDYYIYKINNYTSYNSIYISYSYTALASSYKNYTYSYITTNLNYSSNLYVYGQNGLSKQNITFNLNYCRAMDAGNTYLVTADSGGYLNIISYTDTTDIVINVDFPGWAIALMVSFIFLLCVIGVVVMVVRAKKRRQAQQAAGGYNQFNN